MKGDVLKDEFLPKYLSIGEQAFYKFLLIYALNKVILIEKKNYKGVYPDLELLDYYNRFIILYRQEGEEVYLQIARVFRKASQKIYSILLKKDLTKYNNKFLNLIG